MLFLFILFVVLPISEIMLIISVSGEIGGWNTFLVVIVTAFLGAFFVKREGLATLQRVQSKANQGQLPGKELIEGLMLLVAGVLLVTPGFITDGIGLLFTLPLTRGLIASNFVKVLEQKQAAGQSHFFFNFHQAQSQQRSNDFYQQHQSNSEQSDGDVFEGEYSDKTENDPDKRIK